MQDKDAANGFFLYSLLLDKAKQGSCLIFQHNIDGQKQHLGPALVKRNKQMEGTSHKYYNHTCDLCWFIFQKDDDVTCMFITNIFSAAVID